MGQEKRAMKINGAKKKTTTKRLSYVQNRFKMFANIADKVLAKYAGV